MPCVEDQGVKEDALRDADGRFEWCFVECGRLSKVSALSTANPVILSELRGNLEAGDSNKARDRKCGGNENG